MKFLKNLSLMAMMVFVSPSMASAGGSVGGGTGMVLEPGKSLLSTEQFEALVQAGIRKEPINLQTVIGRVRSVNFEERSVQLEIEGQEGITVLYEELQAF